jgi:hypothetical protein
MNACDRHGCVVEFTGERCPVCSQSTELSRKYKVGFDWARSIGKQPRYKYMTRYQTMVHKGQKTSL